MNRLNEDLLKVKGLENKEENEIQAPLVTAVDPTYTDAKTKHDEIKQRLEKDFKDQEKITKDFIKDTERTEVKTDVKKDLKKLKLDESLFEDYDEDEVEESLLDLNVPVTANVTANNNKVPFLNGTINESDEDDIEEGLLDVNVPITANVTANNNKVPFLGGFIKEDANKDPDFFQLDEDVEEDVIDEAVATMDDIVYRTKRNCLADIIQDELTNGEEVYKLNAKGTLIPTWAPSLNLDEYEVGVDVDDKGEFIRAWMDEADLPKAIEIAEKYNKEYKTGVDTHVRGRNNYIKIYITEEDWDQPYFDPNVKTRKDIAS